MTHIRSLKDNGGVVFYPLTHEKGVRDSNGVTLDDKLTQIDAKSFVVSWNGTSTPTVGNIPAGVTVTYNSTSYTGTLAASSSTMGRVYLVKNGSNYDQYITSQSGTSYSWVPLGSTAMDLTGYATENDLDDLAYDIDGKLDGLTKNVTLGKYLYSTGTTPSSSDWCYSNDYVEVTAGDQVTWNPGLTRNDACIVFYDSSKNVLTNGYYTAANATIRTEPAKPSGAAYMRASFAVSNLANARLLVNGKVVWRAVGETTRGVNDRIDDLEDWVNDPSNYASGADIENIEHEIDVLFNGEKVNYVSGRIIVYSADGTFAKSGWSYNSNYIPVNKNDTLVWTPGATDSNASLVLYDANKTRLTGWSAKSSQRTLTVSSDDAAYCRFSFLSDNIDSNPLLINGEVAWTPVKVDTIGVDERLDALEPAVASLEKPVNLMTGAIFDRLGSANGYYTTSSGKKSYTSTTQVKYIEIPVYPSLESVQLSGFTYTPSTANQNVYTRILFYDAEDTLLDSISTITNSESNSMFLAKPANATQCYVDVPAAHSNEVIIQINASASSADFEKKVRLTLGDKFSIFNPRTGYYTFTNSSHKKSFTETNYVMNIEIPVDTSLTSVRLTGFTYTPGTSGQSVYTRIIYYDSEDNLLTYAAKFTDTQGTEIFLKKPTNATQCYVDVPTIHKDEIFVQINSNSSSNIDPYDKYIPSVASLAYTKGSNPLVLVHFSDIHGGTDNYGRLNAFVDKMGSYINDVISTGDNVFNSWSDSFSYWTNETMLNVIGNHDTAKYTSGGNPAYEWTYYAGKQAYDRYFAPFIENWGVTQPEGAAENGYCYYYKDYSTQGIRLIVLDVMEWEIDENQRQLTWLSSTLTSARTANLAVVIAVHGPAATGDITPMNSDWMCYLGWSGSSNVIPSGAVSAVDNFITAGGHFICWFGGHTHKDQVGYMVGHNNQLDIVVGTDASDTNNLSYADSARVSGTDSQDLFNVIAFDATQHQIRIVRVGCNINKQLQTRNTLVLGYSADGSSAPTVIRES